MNKNNKKKQVQTNRPTQASILLTSVFFALLLWISVVFLPNSISPSNNLKTPTKTKGIETSAINIPSPDLTRRPTEVKGEEDLSFYESTGAEDSYILDQNLLRVGELQLEYPPTMLVRSSETIHLTVFIPLEVASLVTQGFERINISASGVSENGNNLAIYTKHIMLYPKMAASLNSTSFDIVAVDHAEKFMDPYIPGVPIFWDWIIQAPDYPGEQVIVLSMYLDESYDPSWVGSVKIDVVSATNTPPSTSTNTPNPPTPTITPTSTPTPTPVPDIVIIKNKIVESVSLEVCLGIPAALIVVLTLYDQIKKRLKKKKSAPRK